MYGFAKGSPVILNLLVPHFTQTQELVVQSDNSWEFTNVNFQRDQPDLLYFISRKKSSKDNESELDITNVLAELESIKKHSTNISNDLKHIQRDNQVLWNETHSLRTQYHRQQETIDKIVRFLASIFSKVRRNFNPGLVFWN